jgi:hypothetical protein
MSGNIPIPPRIPGDAVLKTLDVELAKVEELIGDALSQNGYKGAVKVATTANITLSGAQTIDGVAVVGGDKVLVKNQASGVNNGVYDVRNDTTWTRSEVMAVGSSAAGAVVYVTQGTTNANVWFICTNDVGSDVVGTNSLVFSTIGTGDVVGPASSTDNAMVRFDGTTGKLVQNSVVITDDTGNMTGVNSLTTTAFVAAGTTVVAGTGMTATTGNITATAGNVVATAGSVSAGTTVTATGLVTGGTGVNATTGDVVAVAGDIVAQAGDLVATVGSLSVAGNLISTAGTLSLSNAKAGTVTLVAGTATVNTNVVLTASERIFITRRTSGGAAFGTPTVVINATGGAGVASFTVTSLSPADGTTTVATDVGVLDWVVVNSAAFT